MKNIKTIFTALTIFTFSAGIFVHSTVAEAQTRIAAAVNNGVVTTNQVTQRARFLRISGQRGDTVAAARKQLIDEELQFQEGKRVGFSVPRQNVEDAFANVARSNRLTAAEFSKALSERGISSSTFKRFIEARILWQQLVVARARQERRRPAEAQDITSILFNRSQGGKNKRVKEYTIEQIIFVVRKDASKNILSQRRRELEAFRNTNKTCNQASDAAKRLAANGVIMKKLGRFTTDTLPQDIRQEVLTANGQLFTAPKRGENGVGILAICNTREIVDNTTSPDELNFNIGQLDNDELAEKSAKWLKELRDRAKIVIR